ncbi:MAG: hypothetical protein HRU38_06025 [Saccharospirillaceae bacterium]|nr:hypothetical protein [Pseudomonadales bacterium]NRB78215.1 hypothetical protein [Saccharospirillaceae bacterium]
MKLPDFTDFEPFNNLREQMGAELWALDETFNEQLHISLSEKALLTSDYMAVSLDQLSRDVDYRLRYKNANVVLIDENIFHLAACQNVLKKQGIQKVSWEVTNEMVCMQCLHQMNFDGVNLQKSRRQVHNQTVFDNFNLQKYWQNYPNFPLKSHYIALKTD